MLLNNILIWAKLIKKKNTNFVLASLLMELLFSICTVFTTNINTVSGIVAAVPILTNVTSLLVFVLSISFSLSLYLLTFSSCCLGSRDKQKELEAERVNERSCYKSM